MLYRDNGARAGLAIHRNGTMAVYDEQTTTGADLLAAGVWNTMSFGPALVNDGEVQKSASSTPTTSCSSSSTAAAPATAGGRP